MSSTETKTETFIEKHISSMKDTPPVVIVDGMFNVQDPRTTDENPKGILFNHAAIFETRKIVFHPDGSYRYVLSGKTTIKTTKCIWRHFKCEHSIEFFPDGTYEASYYPIDRNYLEYYKSDSVSFPSNFKRHSHNFRVKLDNKFHNLTLSCGNIDKPNNQVKGTYTYNFDGGIEYNVYIGKEIYKVRFYRSKSMYEFVTEPNSKSFS